MQQTRRTFLISAAATLGSSFMLPTLLASQSVGSRDRYAVLSDPQWGFSDAEIQRLSGLIDLGLLEVDLVATLPRDTPTQHLGWPVATQLPTGRVVVLYRRAKGHTDQDDAPQAGHYVMYSDDLVNWQPQQPKRLGTLPGMHCIGHAVRPDGGDRVLAITSGKPRILYISDDYGASWQSYPGKFDEMLKTAPHVGPNMINHPDFGVVVAFGQETGGGRRNYMLNTTDAGDNWNERIWLNKPGARGFEPTLATWGPGHMVMISRESHASFAVGPDGFFGHSQHVYRHRAGAPFRSVKFVTRRSNIIGNPAAGSSCNDTAEVIFNPVSERIEVMQSHRWGGGLGNTGTTIVSSPNDEISSLNLWSIDPEALLAGNAEWRFDGTIAERIGYSRKGNRDGLHPGGSIIDIKTGMQHVYVYAGWRRTPSSIFRISRTLDTDRWRQAVL